MRPARGACGCNPPNIGLFFFNHESRARTPEGGRVAATEIMLNTPRIAELILKGKIGEIKGAMQQSSKEGGQTFDMALVKLCQEGKITHEQAIANADSQNEVRLQLKMNNLQSDESIDDLMGEAKNLTFDDAKIIDPFAKKKIKCQKA